MIWPNFCQKKFICGNHTCALMDYKSKYAFKNPNPKKCGYQINYNQCLLLSKHFQAIINNDYADNQKVQMRMQECMRV